MCGACFGLLLFSAMIVCGMLAGNSVEGIVLRAVFGLFGGFVMGLVVGWVGLLVVAERPAEETESPSDAIEEATEVTTP